MTSHDADRLLVQRIRTGDADAWQECIDRYEGRLTSFVDSRLRNRAASEDVVQDAFMGFLISLPNYDDRTPLESWLFTIAAHKLTDFLRREGRRPTIPLAISDGDQTSFEPAGTARKASSMVRSQERKTVEQAVIVKCLGELITDWFDSNDFDRLQCMELIWVLGWSNKMVAQRMNISEQKVANHKSFVISKLKAAADKARLRDFNLADFGIE